MVESNESSSNPTITTLLNKKLKRIKTKPTPTALNLIITKPRKTSSKYVYRLFT